MVDISGTKFCPAYINYKKKYLSRLYQPQNFTRGPNKFLSRLYQLQKTSFVVDISTTNTFFSLPAISGSKNTFCSRLYQPQNFTRGPNKFLSRLYQLQKTSFVVDISTTNTFFFSPCYKREQKHFLLPLISTTKFY